MSALQSVMSQLVISIRCNCITPAAESDSKKGGRIWVVRLRTGTGANAVTSRIFTRSTFIDPLGDDSICRINSISTAE